MHKFTQQEQQQANNEKQRALDSEQEYLLAEQQRIEAERAAYQQPKSVGEQVCLDSRSWFYKVKIRAFVEQVRDDRINLRISSVPGNSMYYQGNQLHNGMLIWDDYYNWRQCSN